MKNLFRSGKGKM
ncbi:rCG63298 [Rattus norvegicus]|uniref:RCG63298 n=1 Tax=Rattus norvegicus TaxID=10116 RepID=A6K4G6_RAT|nr:rCG63298 [Rattus norvegicus]